jgi:hypothetical protein
VKLVHVSETCVTCDVDGTEEVSIKVEEAADMKNELPEATKFPPIKTENEVRLWGVCEVVATHAFGPFIAAKEIVDLHLTNSCCVPYFQCYMAFETCIKILKIRDCL